MRRILCALMLLAAGTSAAPAAADYPFMRLNTQVALDPDNSDSGTDLLLRYEIPFLEGWINEMSQRMLRILPSNSVLRNNQLREEFLATVYYESARAGLDPQWVLAVIQVESAFRKFAISQVGARGYMQVMPFWVELIGKDSDNLFHLRTNLRYGTVILRHYLDIEQGDLFRALGRYNGSLGKPKYPDLVLAALRRNWDYNYNDDG